MSAPTRLALFGDIHANHPALMAVLNAIDAAGITAGACTGDVVMRGRWPGECIDELRARGWPCTRGNTDHKVATRPPRAPDDPKAQRPGSRSWTSARLNAEQVAYLGALPLVVRLDVDGVRVAVMHGSPSDPRAAVTPESDDRELIELGERADADVIVMGHVHRPMIRRVADRLFVNPGAVGEAFAGDRRPRWAWLEADNGRATVHLERVDAPLATIRER